MASIFGPIQSRRFGLSLGIDLSAELKQCNFDCLYCELAPAATTDHQTSVTPVTTIIEELQATLHQHGPVDVITITANGEPTLYPHLQALIEAINTIKGNTQTLILTNSATLHDPAIFDQLLKLDQVKLSLDAATPAVFAKIDRPHPGIHMDEIIASVMAFSHSFAGRLFMEILFVEGINDGPEEIAALNSVLKRLEHVDRIDIGTIDRPPAYAVKPLSFQALHHIATLFDAALPVHIASRHIQQATPSAYSDDEILNTLDKRPLTDDDIMILWDQATREHFADLRKKKRIVTKERGGLTFYICAENQQRKRQ
jgi:wyosine [tRNA(Phe)-imidazoG37] synthetase (radical SAM superfamily)